MTDKKFNPTEFERRLGQIIHLTRNRFGMSQKDLAERIGITFQQIQKYETGENRIPAGRLYGIAKCFDMTIGELVDGAQHEYIHDPHIKQTIELMYKMDDAARRFMMQSAMYVTGATPA